MAVPVSEYELEALPELEGEGEFQNRRFFAVLSNLTRRVPSRPSLPARVAMSAAHPRARPGFPALPGTGLGGMGLDPSRGLAWSAARLSGTNPILRMYPDAMMEHLGHAAAETHSEAEAQALAGAMVPLAARIVPRAAPAIMRAAPGLVCGLTGVVNTLRRNPATRPLVRTVPAIV